MVNNQKFEVIYRLIFIVVFISIVSACDTTKRDVNKVIDLHEKQFAQILKDPDSIKIKNKRVMTSSLTKNKDGIIIIPYCFDYAAKNSYGAYNGYKTQLLLVLYDTSILNNEDKLKEYAIGSVETCLQPSGEFLTKQICPGESITVDELTVKIASGKIMQDKDNK